MRFNQPGKSRAEKIERYLIDGYTLSRIADKLSVSEKTIYRSITPEMKAKVTQHGEALHQDQIAKLLCCLMKGQEQKAIAKKLAVSVHTVANWKRQFPELTSCIAGLLMENRNNARRRKIEANLKAGKSCNLIAETLGISERTLTRWKHEINETDYN